MWHGGRLLSDPLNHEMNASSRGLAKAEATCEKKKHPGLNDNIRLNTQTEYSDSIRMKFGVMAPSPFYALGTLSPHFHFHLTLTKAASFRAEPMTHY